MAHAGGGPQAGASGRIVDAERVAHDARERRADRNVQLIAPTPPISSTVVGVMVTEIMEFVADSTEPPATMIRCATSRGREAASIFPVGKPAMPRFTRLPRPPAWSSGARR